MIDINNVVDVDLRIVQGLEEYDVNAYSACLYIVPDTWFSGDVDDMILIESVEQLQALEANDENSSILNLEKIEENVKHYFANNGQKLLICGCAINGLGEEKFESILLKAREKSQDFIFVVLNNQFVPTTTGSDLDTGFAEVCNYIERLKAPNTVRLCVTTEVLGFSTILYDLGLSNHNIAVKYSKLKQNNVLLDAALLIPAYFSTVMLDEENSLKDYCYTPEVFGYKEGDEEISGVCNVSSEEYNDIINIYNFIDKIGKNVVNFGGNYVNTQPIDTDFGVIALENEICNELLNAVIGKQYLTENGLTNVKGIVDSVLNKYVFNGFIQSNCTYSGEKYEYIYNNKKYLVISRNELLEKGYKIFTIPLAHISKDDYKNRKFTPIIIVMETNKGARTIKIEGLVR